MSENILYLMLKKYLTFSCERKCLFSHKKMLNTSEFRYPADEFQHFLVHLSVGNDLPASVSMAAHPSIHFIFILYLLFIIINNLPASVSMAAHQSIYCIYILYFMFIITNNLPASVSMATHPSLYFI